ncbi:MAG: CDC48 family AAA ATPase [Nanoarchaeota archaeon]|nr:CDC48 family AAA ATPase [Nanoarchaeota archaeon]
MVIKKKEESKGAIKLRVAEAMSDDAYRGIVRIDEDLMREFGLERGDIISIKGTRETNAIIDKSYPADRGQEIIRMDAIIRKNAKADIGELVIIKPSPELIEVEEVTIVPAQKGIKIEIRGNPDSIKNSLLGRVVRKGDLLVLGGTSRRRDLMSDPFEDFLGGGLGEIFGQMGFGFNNMGAFGGGGTQLKFLVSDTSKSGPAIIGENTKVNFKGNYEADVVESIMESDVKKTLEIAYEDIGGLKNEIGKIREMVEIPMKHPEVFERLGIEPPKGVLLYGPPGTGKTLLAKAVAAETDAHFILLNGPEIMSKFYGESEKKIREIFDEAEKNAPAIIFIDEIDSIAPKREDSGGEVERRVVSQLLTMMDGLQARGKVVVIGATNRINVLDPALRRPGRFDREIEVGVPDKEGRLQILQIHRRNMPLCHWDYSICDIKLDEYLDKIPLENKEKIIASEDKIKKLNQEKISKIDLIKGLTEKFETSQSEKDSLSRKHSSQKRKLIQAINELNSFRQESENKWTDNLLIKLRLKQNEVSEQNSAIKKLEEDINKTMNSLKKSQKELESLDEKIEHISNEKKSLDEKIIKLKEDILTLKKVKNKRESFSPERRKELSEAMRIKSHRLNILGKNDPRAEMIEDAKRKDQMEYSTLIEDLENALGKKIYGQFQRDVNDSSVEVMLGILAGRTHGFVGADISALTKEAAMNVLKRKLPNLEVDEEKISEEKLKDLIITEEDFNASLRVVKPSAMREVLVEAPNVGWEDIGGLKEIKQDLQEAVEWPLKHPDSFTKMGIRPPKGILLYGPPGTGKTLLAKAVANESEANFIQIKGPELLSMWVGKSEEGVRKIFEKARQVSPCIIFFDEIDSIANRRGGGIDGGSRVTENVLNQLLAEMDGIEDLTNVIVIGATNRPDILDPALMRPGRFDRIVYVPVPEKDGRLQILKIHTEGMPLAESVSLNKLAEETEGYTGADIESLVREAAMLALREVWANNEDIETKKVTNKHLEKAMEKVLPSVSKNDQQRYKLVESKYLRSAKAALNDSSRTYAG